MIVASLSGVCRAEVVLTKLALLSPFECDQNMLFAVLMRFGLADDH